MIKGMMDEIRKIHKRIDLDFDYGLCLGFCFGPGFNLSLVLLRLKTNVFVLDWNGLDFLTLNPIGTVNLLISFLSIHLLATY